jgi:hypothetical protein
VLIQSYCFGCRLPRLNNPKIKVTINANKKHQNRMRNSQAKLTKNHPKPKTTDATMTIKKKMARNIIGLPP